MTSSFKLSATVVAIGATLIPFVPALAQDTKVLAEPKEVSPDQASFIKETAELIADAVNDPSFATRVRGHDFNGKTHFKAKGAGTTKKTNEEVLTIIRRGLERGTTDNNRTIHMEVTLRPLRKGTVGVTTLGKNPIRTSYWFAERCMERNDKISMARHLMHEWLHVAGFHHYPDNSARGDVPYEVGQIVRDVLKAQAGSNNKLLGVSEDPLAVYLLEEASDDVDIADVD